MKKILIILICIFVYCVQEEERFPDECNNWVVTCVFNEGFGKNVFVADSIESYDGKFSVIFVDGKRTELGCDEIFLRRKKCI